MALENRRGERAKQRYWWYLLVRAEVEVVMEVGKKMMMMIVIMIEVVVVVVVLVESLHLAASVLITHLTPRSQGQHHTTTRTATSPHRASPHRILQTHIKTLQLPPHHITTTIPHVHHISNTSSTFIPLE